MARPAGAGPGQGCISQVVVDVRGCQGMSGDVRGSPGEVRGSQGK